VGQQSRVGVFDLRKSPYYNINNDTPTKRIMYYTYAYLREDGTPYYIGKGKGKRVYSNNGKPCVVPKNKNQIIFLKQNLTEEEAYIHEIYMISILGRIDIGTGILRNKSNGGEGKSGYIHTQETKNKISQAVKGKNHPLYGCSPSSETRRKMSDSLKGRIITDECRAKMSESHKGRPPTYGFKGKTHTEETLQNMRNRKWWNNGQINKTSVECPGVGWVRGMLKESKGR
jgi:hypothetical protein